MITVAFGEMFFFLENNPLSAWTGGENGLPSVPTPRLRSRLHDDRTSPPAGRSTASSRSAIFVGFVIALRIVRSPVGAVLTRDPRQPAARRAPSATTSSATSSPSSSSPPPMPASPAACSACCRASCRPSLHLRHLRPARDADRDRRRRHAVRPAGRRRALALSCSDFLQIALRPRRAWKLVLGVVFVLLICSCAAAWSAASSTSIDCVRGAAERRAADEAPAMRDAARAGQRRDAVAPPRSATAYAGADPAGARA